MSIGLAEVGLGSGAIPQDLQFAERRENATQLLTPDCGLKTRRWEEVKPALTNMVQAAHALRAELAAVPR